MNYQLGKNESDLIEKNSNKNIQEKKEEFILPRKPVFFINKNNEKKYKIENLSRNILELFINSQWKIFVIDNGTKIILKDEDLDNVLKHCDVIWKLENSSIKVPKEVIEAVIVLNIGKHVAISTTEISLNNELFDGGTIYRHEITDVYDNNGPKPRIKK